MYWSALRDVRFPGLKFPGRVYITFELKAEDPESLRVDIALRHVAEMPKQVTSYDLGDWVLSAGDGIPLILSIQGATPDKILFSEAALAASLGFTPTRTYVTELVAAVAGSVERFKDGHETYGQVVYDFDNPYAFVCFMQGCQTAMGQTVSLQGALRQSLLWWLDDTRQVVADSQPGQAAEFTEWATQNMRTIAQTLSHTPDS
jgi:hypothetical protein